MMIMINVIIIITIIIIIITIIIRTNCENIAGCFDQISLSGSLNRRRTESRVNSSQSADESWRDNLR